MATAAIVLAIVLALPAHAETRSRSTVRQFYRLRACPVTLEAAPPCPGYVVDHIVPLCAGGADTPRNMQWQERAESLAKDRVEREMCRWIRKGQP